MNDDKVNLERRNALKLIASTATLPLALQAEGTAATESSASFNLHKAKAANGKPSGTRSDPDMHNPVANWEMLLDEQELVCLKSMCNLIIPADAKSSGAGDLGAQHYINEHVSAPYDWCKQDLITVRGGLVWLNSESSRRYDKLFIELKQKQQHKIFDDICWEDGAKPEFKGAARFFAKVRDLTATAFYSTEQGMKDVGFVGNKPLASFDGPPREILEKLKLV